MKEIAKYFLLWFIGIFIVGCSLKESESSKKIANWSSEEVVGPALDVDGHPGSIPKETETVVKEYHVTYTSSPTDSSYWFVQLEFIREGGGKTTTHGAVGLPMPYFDFELARKDFSRKGEAYFEFFTQITKEGYDSFYRYAKNNE